MNIEMPQTASDQASAPLEFQSVQMVLDHMQVDAQSNHLIQKFVMSTQTQLESLHGLASYYQMLSAISSPAALAIIQAMNSEEAPILVLTTPENTQVLFQAQDWGALAERFETQYAMCDWLARAVADQYAASINRAGGIPSLLMFGLSAAPVPSAAE